MNIQTVAENLRTVIADLPNSADGKYDAFLPSEMIAKHFGVK